MFRNFLYAKTTISATSHILDRKFLTFINIIEYPRLNDKWGLCAMTHYLDMVNSPEDLKLLTKKQLIFLAREIRKKIITTVAQTGGHLASSLGVVELTIALHYVFNLPKDKLVWDVGHQCYTHKLLTGRKHKFCTLRQYKGISGFPKITESNCDSFGTGHASTSISAALGMAKARDLKKDKNKIIAIIGDGALTGGIALEGLNQAGALKSNILVILNDNKMSISPNVGALSKYLSRMVTSKQYHTIRNRMRVILGMLSDRAAQKAMALEETLRSLINPGMWFKEMGFRYFGPINGHNIDSLIKAFENIKQMKGPILLHVITRKGKGYVYAENNKTEFHGISPFDITNGKTKDNPSATYTKIFASTMTKLAKNNDKIVVITAAMTSGTGLAEFAKLFPKRFFDVGIAEQHAVTFAGGLAINGFKPVCAIYSTFLQRAYDQIIHDICLQKLPVVFAIDRAGLVGEDGPTHHGPFDISYLRHIPNIVLMAPKDENELQHMLNTAVNYDGPIAIRYPRGKGFGVKLDEKFNNLDIGKAEILKKGNDIVIFAIGTVAKEALKAANELKKIDVCIVNARFAKPLDEKLIISLAKRIKNIITIEENTLEGGFGSSILELLEKNNIKANVKRIGLPDMFIEQGDLPTLREKYGLTKKNIIKTVREMIK